MKRYVATKAVEVLGLHQKGHDQRGRCSALCHGVALYQEHRRFERNELRFCLKKSCVTNIKGTLRNVKIMDDNVTRCPDVVLSEDKETNVRKAGIVIQ